jgi:hypothetical protein
MIVMEVLSEMVIGYVMACFLEVLILECAVPGEVVIGWRKRRKRSR